MVPSMSALIEHPHVTVLHVSSNLAALNLCLSNQCKTSNPVYVLDDVCQRSAPEFRSGQVRQIALYATALFNAAGAPLVQRLRLFLHYGG
jgi:hypothetical protein